MMDDRVSIDMKSGVADVRLIRSDKLNALDGKMMAALVEAGESLAADRNVRAVVISGEGRAFCAGLDMATFARMAGSDSESAAGVSKALDPDSSDGSDGVGRLERRTRGIANAPQYTAWVWREMPVPVVAAVHGFAMGGGFQLMLGADIRYVAADARLSIMEIKWGLVPDMGGTPIMRNLAREDIIRELTYTGRIFSGEEALEYGFATRVVDDPYAAALETAREIACKSPDAIRGSKRIFNAANDAGAAEGLLKESTEQDRLIGSANQIEAVMANLEKREPRFRESGD